MEAGIIDTPSALGRLAVLRGCWNNRVLSNRAFTGSIDSILAKVRQLSSDNDMLSSKLDDALEQNLLFSDHNDVLKEHIAKLIKGSGKGLPKDI